MKARKILKVTAVALAISTIIIGMCFYIAMKSMSEGSLPSHKTAVSFSEEIHMIYSSKSPDLSIKDLPSSVLSHKPINLFDTGEGVILIFQKRFVADYGYYYGTLSNELKERNPFIGKEISRNVYEYYNPG